MIHIKRAYDKKHAADGCRILIDGLWPRGVTKETTDLWIRQVAPTPPLRKWFHHDPEKFPEFKKRYKHELAGKKVFLRRIKGIEAEKGTITLLYGAKDQTHNNAVVVKEVLEALP
jgi:uncharacterized protein YeaO (DUF488 family)